MHNYRNPRTAEAVAAFWGKSLKDKNWYSMEHNGDETEIRIYDVIGWPFIEAEAFVRELDRIDASHITVAINSPGGDVFDGTAIYNALKRHPAAITTRIDGIAASMASVITLAGDEIQIAANAYYMIHNAWGLAIGDYRDMEKARDLLDKISDTLAGTYTARTGIKNAEVRTMMDDETWLVGSELVEQGFADTVLDAHDANARFNLDMYAHAPEEFNGKRPKAAPKTIRELEHGLRAMGYSRSESTRLASTLMSAQSDSAPDHQSESDALQVSRQLLANLQALTA